MCDMYVMLVDDETHILSGIARFLTRKWPDLEVCEFDNGFDALSSIAQRKPGLLITDINMPDMDGLELVEKATDLGVKHYAMLTGYDDFSLVQHALRLHAMDYLLKPVDKEQLYHVVEQAMHMEDMEHEAEQANMRNGLRLLCQFNVSQYDLLSPPDPERVFGGCELFALLLLDGDAVADNEVIAAISPLQELAEELFSLGTDRNHHAMYIMPIRQETRSRITEAAKALYRKPFFRGFAIAPASLDALHEAYRQALEATATGLQQAVSAYYTHTDNLEPVITALDCLLSGIETFAERMSMMWRFLSAIKCQQNTWVIVSMMSEYPLRPEQERRKLLLTWLENLGSASWPKSREILLALDIIDQKYQDDLNLLQISKQVFMTPSYFSTLFHHEMGETYVEYVNRIRISKSCLCILQGEDLSIENIAAQVGFQNTHYFYKIFKRYTGMTPGIFRELAK